jgi:hypothetical protein
MSVDTWYKLWFALLLAMSVYECHRKDECKEHGGTVVEQEYGRYAQTTWDCE